MLEWLIAALVIINVVFLSVLFFFLKIKETNIDPMTLSMLGSGDPQKSRMLSSSGDDATGGSRGRTLTPGNSLSGGVKVIRDTSSPSSASAGNHLCTW